MVYKLTLQRNSDNHVLINQTGTNAENVALEGRVVIDDISQCVPHCSPSISNQNLMLGDIVTKTATVVS